MAISLTSAQFEKFQRFIYQAFGINLPEAKREMLANRLRQMLVEQGFVSFDDYYQAKLTNPTPATLNELINRVSTNHTYFYREATHFEHLRKQALPEVVPAAERRSRGSRKEFRMWCAAASTGQEPYGLAIQLREFFGSAVSQWQAGLLATDISERALKEAQQGMYDEDEVEPIPVELRRKYFKQVGARWAVAPQLKQDVTYRRLNLMNTQFPFKKPFDVIFCRNVMIYFDADTKRALVKRLHDNLYPGGYLYVGLAESLGQLAGPFKTVSPGIYKRVG